MRLSANRETQAIRISPVLLLPFSTVLLLFRWLAPTTAAWPWKYGKLRRKRSRRDGSRPWWRRRVVALILTLIEVALLVSASVMAVVWPTLLRWLELDRFGWLASSSATLANWVVVTVALLAAFELANYFGPDVKKKWQWITPGSVLGVLVLVGASLGFRAYLYFGTSYSETYGALAGVVWASSPYLRARVSLAIEQVQTFGVSNVNTPVGLRLEYWTRSSAFIAEAPVFGHGTGTIPKLFQRDATPGTISELLTDNPHSQILTVMLQLGLVGAAALLAMWIAHLALFRDRTLVAWFGLVVAMQNIVGSLFNSYLFDFSQGWLYVFGVGVAGGMVLHGAPRTANAEGET